MSSTEPPTEPPTELKTYNGSCHCKAVQYTVTTKPLEEQSIIQCNCSICSDRASLIFFVPSKDIQITGNSLSDPYTFNKGQILYRFCKKCGSSVFGHNEERTQYGVNWWSYAMKARTIHGIDINGLKLVPHDGASA